MPRPPRAHLALWSCVVVAAPCVAHAAAPLDFTRDVRPILADACFSCHGPDAAHRKAGLRLDTRDGALADLGGTRAVVPGEPGKSALVERIRTKDADDLMPPPGSGKKLTPAQIAVLERWVAEGAPWKEHWAFTPLARPTLPPVSGAGRNEIDAFVQAQLPAGVRPAPEADRRTLIRRLALDLTGLPPALDDVEAFLADRDPGAYEALVDRTLASPAYGERWARLWLDLARYADSRGYERDPLRTMWRYRDWVIAALNADMPFDRFTVEQLAGDLLPSPGRDQLLATAFHRNTMTNDEGGTDDEEFRVAAVKDRVDTTLQVWMGLTAGCARCHDHKYDPVSQRDYYGLYAIFDQSEDADRSDERPTLPFPTPEQERALAAATARVSSARAAIDGAAARIAPRVAAWERAWAARFRATTGRPPASVVPAAFGGWHSVGPFSWRELAAPLEHPFPPEREGAEPSRRYETPAGSLGWVARGDWRDGAIHELDDYQRGVIYGARVFQVAVPSRLTFAFSATTPVRLWLDGRLIIDRDDRAVVSVPVAPGEHRLLLKAALGSGKETMSFRVADEETAGEPVAVARLLATPPRARTADQRSTIAEHYLRRHHPPAAPLLADLDEARRALRAVEREIPAIPVMRELPAEKRRQTHLHVSGNFLEKGEKVAPAVLARLAPFPPGAPATRLGLAQWLTSPANPLTARVAANRLWAQLFGLGLVETEEDFGAQGSPPSHPELLDWLATELVRGGWSQKRLLRTIVLSATYRQSSAVTPALLARDPRNRLLARGPRFRLDAEAIRDAALAAAGLLSRKLYGPSVMPPQPEGIWRTAYSAARWITPANEDRWRRGIYTLIRRTAPYPSLLTFDGPSRETCTIRRLRSNTPLQALVTLNDPVFVEAAQGLARRVLRETDGPVERRIGRAFELALARPATGAELTPLLALYGKRLAHYRASPAAARAMATNPLGPLPDGTPVGEAAALTAVANVILNLDEFLTKG